MFNQQQLIKLVYDMYTVVLYLQYKANRDTILFQESSSEILIEKFSELHILLPKILRDVNK